MRAVLRWGGIALAGLAGAGAAYSQSYPSKPVRIEVGYVPGGGVDTTARMVGQALGELWGSTVTIENRPGAAGNIATEYTAKAPTDGYTLVLCNIGSHAVTPARFAKKHVKAEIQKWTKVVAAAKLEGE